MGSLVAGFAISFTVACSSDDEPSTSSGDDAGASDDEDDSDAGADGSSELAGYLAELDEHEGVDCDEDDGDYFCTIEGDEDTGEVTEDLTVRNFDEIIWQLRDDDNYVFIGDDEEETVLTIEPGVKVFAVGSTALVVQRGSRIEAEGTAEEPIVFTSGKSVGDRATGDWGGLVLNGRASTNNGEDVAGEASTGTYGGDEDDDNSGTLKFVRVEFAGNQVDPDNELNGIAFQGVGSETTVENIQVHFNADDGIEFFGGTVSVKNVVLTGIGDDSLDWTGGWRGTAQFVLIDQLQVASDNGMECDNNSNDIAATPVSAPKIANVTLIGSGERGTDEGIQLRAGTNGQLFRIAMTGFSNGCLTVQTEPTAENVELNESVFDCGDPEEDLVFGHLDEDGEPTDVEASQEVFEAGDPENKLAELQLDGWVPDSDSPLLDDIDPLDVDGLEASEFIGAIGEDDWTQGWTETAVE